MEFASISLPFLMMRGGGGMEVRGGLGQWVWCHADVYWLLVATMVGSLDGGWWK